MIPATDFMREALRLARRGREQVSPNPMVGAVLVRKGRVVGRGWHRRFGGPHAEVEAIRSGGAACRGADLYVTLEPCAHHGKTPPCAEAIRRAGIRRVFYAASDPNPLARGRGPRRLRRCGVAVRGGLLAGEARDQNAPYFHWRRTGRPWVILKWAMTADGKIAARSGDSRWISGERSRRQAHRMRRRVDAILVGTGTLLRDDPLLVPRPERGRVPLRVILDRRGRLPLRLQVLRPGSGPRLYVTSHRTPARRRRRIAALGLEVLAVPERRGGLDLEALLDALGRRGISQLLVEGGEKLHGELWDLRLVQEVAVFLSPRVLGGAGAFTPVGGRGPGRLAGAVDLRKVRLRRLGRDLLLEGIV